MRAVASSSAAAAAALSVAALFVGVWPCAADLPVHCLRHQVVGEWEFTLGPLGDRRTSCGHQTPDNAYQQPAASSLLGVPGEATSVRRFSLRDPDEVAPTEESAEPGTWTMIYDEGFEVRSGDFVYFAFSKFDFESDGAGGKRNISRCAETQVGWYRNRARTRWGCYFGRKVGGGGDASAVADAGAEGPRLTTAADVSASVGSSSNHTAAAAGAAGEEVSATAYLDAAGLSTLPAEYTPWVPGSAGYDKPMHGSWRRSVAEALNFLQFGWTATAYDDKFSGKSPRELNRLAGVRRGRLRPANVSAEPLAKAAAASFLGLHSKRGRGTARGRVGGGSFDWRHQDGRSFLTPVVEQGDCGSCYTISTIHMLTARNRIRLGDPSAPEFSVSFPLYCSEYNQGCDGGYGFLQSKWAEDVGLLPESCAPFSTGGGECQVTPGCDLGGKRYRAVNHHYVGGYYGGSSESSIRQELVKNGPMVISFEPKEDFMYYKSGVYRSGPARLHQEWEQVDHAVLLVAYGNAGESQGGAYWTMQNSWGKDWGEEGYFRMARGGDESGCESIAVAAEVVEADSNPVLDNFLASL
eukprot:TRINITY_DN73577_c0_g1_i1.p1 TRINITY_DN73577_c0_g1~~TRINITY_DN73577_c0_g1_i1.p1  ORF type:complete len:580 (+),score=98.65 TRINITY_DN73577_c0_g1_i1:99-1838(+)